MRPKSKVQSDRRLLWHGSRTTQFGGILCQGLRVPPPEAPKSAYKLGKGIYLGDMSSNSAKDCAAHASGGIGLLLLCEAELGTSAYTLSKSMDHNKSFMFDRAIKSGTLSVKGSGAINPAYNLNGWQVRYSTPVDIHKLTIRKDAGKCVNKKLKDVKMPNFQRPYPYRVPKKANREDRCAFTYDEYVVLNEAQIQMRYLFRIKITGNDDWRRSVIDPEYEMEMPEQYVQTLIEANEMFGLEYRRYLEDKELKEAKDPEERKRTEERHESERVQRRQGVRGSQSVQGSQSAQAEASKAAKEPKKSTRSTKSGK